MRHWRAVLVLMACGGFLLTAPQCAPRLPEFTWAAERSWLLADPQRAVTLLTGFAAWLIAAWLFVVAALTLLAAHTVRAGLRARRAADALTPRFARGLLRVLLGAAVAVAAAGPAIGSPAPAATTSSGALPGLAPVPAPVVAAPDLPPLLDLDRPGAQLPRHSTPSPAAPPPGPAHPAPTDPPTVHFVEPGDTLWGLAAERLPAGSSPARITRAWQQWYAANRQEIGADPGLILVGERLAIPRETP